MFNQRFIHQTCFPFSMLCTFRIAGIMFLYAILNNDIFGNDHSVFSNENELKT